LPQTFIVNPSRPSCLFHTGLPAEIKTMSGSCWKIVGNDSFNASRNSLSLSYREFDVERRIFFEKRVIFRAVHRKRENRFIVFKNKTPCRCP
jgi:hypothetical protein